ncbi:hypothetical protein [Roseovarius sp. SYSU LYC5161]|uniref:hypothetical protein n=1 Tax=Roseovarius halophilus (ex Wu et al. 2025) TaxID=3376060 RepID=UPI003999D230
MKPIEHWIALAAAMVFVAMQHREKPRIARVVIAGISGGMGYAMSGEIARVVPFIGQATAIVVVTALIYAFLDTATAIIADRSAIVAAARRLLGGRSE